MLIPGSGRSLGVGNGNPPQCPSLGNPTDRGDWRTAVHGVAKSQTQWTDRAHTHAHTHTNAKTSSTSGLQTS